MIPTIDITAVGILGAISSFGLWLWNTAKGVFEWCQRKFVLWWLGSRLGRSVAEFALFLVWYSFFLYGLNVILNFALSLVMPTIVPSALVDSWRILSLAFPISECFETITFLISLYVAYNSQMVIFSHYLRMQLLLSRLMGVGRV